MLRIPRVDEQVMDLKNIERLFNEYRFRSSMESNIAHVLSRTGKKTSFYLTTNSSDIYTDGKKIVVGLPEQCVGMKYGEIYSIVKASVGHESAHVKWSNFQTMKEYQQEARKRGINVSVAQAIFNIVEDGRIERLLCEDLPGYAKHIKFLNLVLIEKDGNITDKDDVLSNLISVILYLSVLGIYPKNYNTVIDKKERELIDKKIYPLILKGVLTNSISTHSEVCLEIIELLREYIPETPSSSLQDKLSRLASENYQSCEGQDTPDSSDLDAMVQQIMSSQQASDSNGNSKNSKEEDENNENNSSAGGSGGGQQQEFDLPDEEENKSGSGGSSDQQEEGEDKTLGESGDEKLLDENESRDNSKGSNDEENKEDNDSGNSSGENGEDSNGTDKENGEDKDSSDNNSDNNSDTNSDNKSDNSDNNGEDSDNQSNQNSQNNDRQSGDGSIKDNKTNVLPNHMDSSNFQSEEFTYEEMLEDFYENLKEEVQEEAVRAFEKAEKQEQNAHQQNVNAYHASVDLKDINSNYTTSRRQEPDFRFTTVNYPKSKPQPEFKMKIHGLRKAFEKSLKNQETVYKGQKRGRVDSTRLWRIGVNDTSVFKKKNVVEERDYAIEVLIDTSGSMDDRRKYKNAMAAAICIEGALTGLPGVEVKTVAFNYSGGSRLRVLKDFNETESRTPSVYNRDITGGSNRDGFAIRVALDDLKRHRAKNKLLIVISDGMPSCAVESTSESMADVKNAVREGRKFATVLSILINDGPIDDYTKNAFHEMYESKGSILVDVYNKPEEVMTNLVLYLKRIFNK